MRLAHRLFPRVFHRTNRNAADHVNLGMGKIDHAANQRLTDGDQLKHQSERQTIDQLLLKIRHAER